MFAIGQIVTAKKYGRKYPYFHFNPKEHDVIYIMQKAINQSIIKDLLVKSRSFFSITLQQTSVVNYK